MADGRNVEEARTYDAEMHGESAQLRDRRSTPEGEVRTQRGEPGDLPQAALQHGYEVKDVSPRAVSYALLGFILAIVVAGALVAGLLVLLRDAEERPPVSPLAMRELVPPSPRLEVSPQVERAEIEAAAKARLAGYGWVDRDAALAHIPIARAMQLLAEHGWPDPDEAPQAEGASGSEPRP
jgi:hypothetical protein